MAIPSFLNGVYDDPNATAFEADPNYFEDTYAQPKTNRKTAPLFFSPADASPMPLPKNTRDILKVKRSQDRVKFLQKKLQSAQESSASGEGTNLLTSPALMGSKTTIAKQLMAAQQETQKLAGDVPVDEAVKKEEGNFYNAVQQKAAQAPRESLLNTFATKAANQAFFGLPDTINARLSGLSADEYAIAQKAKSAAQPKTIAEKAAEFAGNATGVAASFWLTDGLFKLSGIPLITATKSSQIMRGGEAVATMRTGIAPWYIRAGLRGAGGAELFGAREAIHQGLTGDVNPKRLAYEALVGATFSAVIGGVSDVWHQVMSTPVESTRFEVNPQALKSGAAELPGDTENVVTRFFRKAAGGIERRVEFYMQDGSYYDVRIAPGENGKYAVEYTSYAPTWVRKFADNILHAFRNPDQVIDIKPVSVVPTPEGVQTEAPQDVQRTVAGYLKGPEDQPLANMSVNAQEENAAVSKLTDAGIPLEDANAIFNTTTSPEEIGVTQKFGKDVIAVNRDFSVPKMSIEDIKANPPTKIGDLTVDPESITMAFQEGADFGIKGKIHDPIEIFYNTETGEYTLQNGYHRLLEAIATGQTSVGGEVVFGKNPQSFYIGVDQPLIGPQAHTELPQSIADVGADAMGHFIDVVTTPQEHAVMLDTVGKAIGAHDDVHAEEALVRGLVQYVQDGTVPQALQSSVSFLKNLSSKISDFLTNNSPAVQMQRGIVNQKKNDTMKYQDLPDAVRQDISSDIADITGQDQSDIDVNLLGQDVQMRTMDPQELRRQFPEQNRKTSPLAVANLQKKLESGIELDPIIVNGDQLVDGGHRIDAYIAAGKTEIPVVDISGFYGKIINGTPDGSRTHVPPLGPENSNPLNYKGSPHGTEKESDVQAISSKVPDSLERQEIQQSYDDLESAVQAVEKEMGMQSKGNILDRGERLINELGDVMPEKAQELTSLIDDVTELEYQYEQAPVAKAKTQDVAPAKGGVDEIQNVPRKGSPTLVTGRALVQAISRVSKLKERDFRIKLTKAISEAKVAQKAKDAAKYQQKRAEVEQIKTQMLEEIRKRLPPEARGKMLSAVKNVETRRQLEKALERADKIEQDLEQRRLIGDIKGLAFAPLSNVDVPYREELRQMLAGVDFSKPTEATAQKLRNRLAYIEKTGGFEIPQKLREEVSRLEKTALSEMNNADLRQLRDALQTLVDMGTVSRELKVSRMQREREKALNMLLQTTTNIDPKVSAEDQGYNYTAKTMSEAAKKVNGLWRYRPFFIQTDVMDGYMNGKGENTALGKKMYDAEQKAIEVTYDRMGQLIQRMTNEITQDPELFTPQSQAKMMAAAAYDQKLEAQMEAAGWGYKRPDLTTNQEKLLQILREEVGDGSYQGQKRFPLLAAVNALFHNEYTAKVANYFKVAYADTMLKHDEESLFESRFGTAKMDAAAALSATEGVLKSRTPGVKRPLRTDIMNLAFEALAQQEWIINVEPVLRNLYSVINNPQYTEKGGIKAVETWNRRMKIVAMAWRKHALQFREEHLFSPATNLGLAYMAWKASTAFAQMGQMVTGTSYVLGVYGPKAATQFFMSSILQFFKPGVVTQAANETPFIRFRESGDPITSVIMRTTGVLDQSKWGKEVQAFSDMLQDATNDRNAAMRAVLRLRRKAGRKGLDLVKFFDVRAAAAQYEALKDLFKEYNATPEEAQRDAEVLSMIINNDASASYRPEAMEDVSSIRDPEAKFLKRQLLLFQSFNLNTVAMALHVSAATILKQRPTFLPRGGESSPIYPSKLPGSAGSPNGPTEGGYTLPPQKGGGVFAIFSGLAFLALLAGGAYEENNVKRAINNLISGRKTKGDPSLLAGLILANMQKIPVGGDALQIVRNAMLGKPYNQQIGNPFFDILVRSAQDLGTFIRKRNVKNFSNFASDVLSGLGVPGTRQGFDIINRFQKTKAKF